MVSVSPPPATVSALVRRPAPNRKMSFPASPDKLSAPPPAMMLSAPVPALMVIPLLYPEASMVSSPVPPLTVRIPAPSAFAARVRLLLPLAVVNISTLLTLVKAASPRV